MGAPHAGDTQVIFGVRLPVHLERTIGSPFARAADYRSNIYGIYGIYGGFFFALSRVSQYALHLHPHSPCIKPPRQVARRTMQQADPHNKRPWHRHQHEKRSDTGNQATPGPTS
jgi:hypothetical protein